MTIRHLKIFISVVDYKTMSNAAKKLFISQPSVSQAIREIEEYYNIMLFERLSQKLYLTKDGENLLKYSRYIVSTFDSMEKEFKNKHSNIYIKIGGSLTFGTYILPNIMEKFEAKYTNVDSKIIVDNTKQIEEKIINNELDIGIVEGETQNTDIVKLPILKDRLVIVCSINHELAKKENVTLKDLYGKAMIAREDGSKERSQFQRFLNQNNIKVDCKWNCTSVETIKNALKKGQGFAVLSIMAVKDEIERNELKAIEVEQIENLSRDLCLIYHKNKFLNEEINYFIKLCKDFQQDNIF
ncbi:LysR family transcriptional regulator [uncultured Tyzzerella sp.]|uniref:LysR family transcriptional regulator n=1 Tax=uncultured Tyzzerella sp. TaxID=2321398 RepID=UPI002941F461|nr:LysR family transcriptional regulator [uncultured Tyzzerella sp.]